MKRYVGFLLLFSTLSLYLQGQCDWSYISNIGALKERINTTAASDTECIQHINVLDDLIDAYLERDKELIDDIYQSAIGSGVLTIQNELELTYSYASILDALGHISLANYFYIYVYNSSNKGDFLNILSRTNSLGKSVSAKQVDELFEELETEISLDRFSPDQELDLMLNIYPLLPLNLKKRSFKVFDKSYNAAADVNMKSHFASLLAYHSINMNSPNSLGHIATASVVLKESTSPANGQAAQDMLEIKRLNFLGKYLEALELSIQLNQRQFGLDNISLPAIDSIYNVGGFDRIVLLSYARTNLMQTRVGGGISDVEEGYKIFQRVAENDLVQRLQITEDLLSTNKSSIEDNYLNQFIIGVYLYQKTNNLNYLNKSLSILDAAIAGGLTSQLALNERRRADPSLDERINAINKVAAELSEIGVKLPLEEVIEKATWLQKEREAVFTSRTEGELYTQLDLEELQRTMAVDSAAAVGFYEIDGLAYRLYVSADTIDVAFQGDLPRAVATLSDSVAAAATYMPETDDDGAGSASYELFTALFNGFTEKLPENLYIVATGSVEGVPFNVLRKDSLSNQPSYLGLEHAIARQFSIGNMLRLSERPTRADYPHPLALAPDFPGGPNDKNWYAEVMRGAEDNVSLPPLTYNATELDNLKELSTGRYLSGKAATAENYLTYARRYGILHLATHAISNEHDGIASRVYLLDKSGNAEAINARTISNQLLSADLVTLSACETSRGGRNTLEGTIGLTRAYIAAGARSVVASNWSVEDRATAELMAGFYERTTAGAPPHVALQQARRAFVAEHPEAHPSRWAAFEVFGGTSPISWVRSNPWYSRASTWLVVSAVAVLGILGILIYKRTTNAQLAR